MPPKIPTIRGAERVRFVLDPKLERYAYRCFPDGCPRDRTCCVGLAVEVSKREVRAIDSLTRTQGIGDLYRVYATTQRDGVDFNLTYIPPTFDVPHNEMFDTAYMKALYDVGLNAAKSGQQWQKYPPGFEAPMQATAASGGR